MLYLKLMDLHKHFGLKDDEFDNIFITNWLFHIPYMAKT